MLACSCVVSATSAVLYAQNLWEDLPLRGPTVIVLLVFALLSAWGLKDSANVALAMFLLHIGTMAVLVVACVVFMIRDGGHLLKANIDVGYPTIYDGNTPRYKGSVFHALFFGETFCVRVCLCLHPLVCVCVCICLCACTTGIPESL